MARDIVFVEHPEQLRHIPPEARIIALTPMVELEAGTFRRPEDYCDERKLEEAGIANFDRVERMCRLVDSAVQRELSLAEAYSLQPARSDFFSLKVLYDAFYLRAYQVLHILREERPGRIFHFTMPGPDLKREWSSPEESLYTSLIEKLASHMGIRCELLPKVRSNPLEPGASAVLPLHHRLKRRAFKKLDQIQDLLNVVSSGKHRGTALCLDAEYNTPFIGRELARRGFEVWVWENDRKPGRQGRPLRTALLPKPDITFDAWQVERAREAVLGIPELQAFWVWEGCNFWEVVRRRLERVFDVCLPEVLKYAVWSGQALGEIQPDLVLVSNLADRRRQAIANAVRSRGIPVVVSHHGGLGNAHIPVMLYQNGEADGYLCFGKGTAAYFRRYARRPPWTAVMGAPMIERALKEAPPRPQIRRTLGLSPDMPVVLYLLTNMHGNFRYFSHQLPSDSAYFRIQRRITSVLGRHPEYQVVIKDHPATPYAPLAAWVSYRGWAHIRVLSSPPFPDLLNLADVVIIDLPATAVLQALRTDCALYVFNDWFRWEPGAREALENSAFYSDDIEVFCERLDGDLATRKALTPRSPEDPYSSLFCRPSPDLSVLQSAVRDLEQFAFRNRKP